MRIVDVCESDSARGCLKLYYRDKKITDYKIMSMCLLLQIGDIKDDHLKFLNKFYSEVYADYEDSDEFYTDYQDRYELLKNINDDTKIRIWTSKGDPSEYLLVLYLCDLLKNSSCDISVINISDFDKSASSVGSTSHKDIDMALKYEHTLTQNDIGNYSLKWNKLVEINSELRVLENDTIINKKYSDYDNIILDYLSKIDNCRYIDLVGTLMGNLVINFSDSSIYEFLIDRLVKEGKIKIVKKADRKSYDIIELNRR